jgi:hypothetical protein
LPHLTQNADAAPPYATPFAVYLRHYPSQWREAWRITKASVLQLRKEVESHGSRFAVVIVDAKEVVSEKRWRGQASMLGLDLPANDADRPHERILQILARSGIPTISLLEEFRHTFGPNASPGFFNWDVHWTAEGHALAGQVVARDLLRLGLLPPRAQD